MDWTQTKNVAEANLDAIVSKTSNPRVALTALEKKITAEVDKVEAHLLALDQRINALPNLLDAADKLVLKIDAVVTKAKEDGRADLALAAGQRKNKHLAERAALEAELNGIDGAMNEADEWLTKLQDKLAEVHARIDRLPLERAAPAAKPAAAPKAVPASASPPAGKTAAKGDVLDDEFSALLNELGTNLSKVELPKKKQAPVKLPDTDDGIPDLVTVADNELPEGEDLPPLQKPTKTAPAKAGVPAAPAKAASTKAAPAKAAAAPAARAPDEKKSKAWLWITAGVIVLGGGGAAVAHFVFGLF